MEKNWEGNILTHYFSPTEGIIGYFFPSFYIFSPLLPILSAYFIVRDFKKLL